MAYQPLKTLCSKICYNKIRNFYFLEQDIGFWSGGLRNTNFNLLQNLFVRTRY